MTVRRFSNETGVYDNILLSELRTVQYIKSAGTEANFAKNYCDNIGTVRMLVRTSTPVPFRKKKREKLFQTMQKSGSKSNVIQPEESIPSSHQSIQSPCV